MDWAQTMTYNQVMIQLNLAEAKAQFSACLERGRRGESVVICRRNVPIAELRPISGPTPRPRQFGQDVGRVVVHAGFFHSPPEEELSLWSGDPTVPI